MTVSKTKVIQKTKFEVIRETHGKFHRKKFSRSFHVRLHFTSRFGNLSSKLSYLRLLSISLPIELQVLSSKLSIPHKPLTYSIKHTVMGEYMHMNRIHWYESNCLGDLHSSPRIHIAICLTR
jgi:hypothetical protein